MLDKVFLKCYTLISKIYKMKKNKILILSVLVILSLFLIPSIIGIRKFADIFSFTVIPVCFFVLIQRIKIRDSIYALALSTISIFFFILGIDLVMNHTPYDLGIIEGLVCFYLASMIFGALDIKKERKKDLP